MSILTVGLLLVADYSILVEPEGELLGSYDVLGAKALVARVLQLSVKRRLLANGWKTVMSVGMCVPAAIAFMQSTTEQGVYAGLEVIVQAAIMASPSTPKFPHSLQSIIGSLLCFVLAEVYKAVAASLKLRKFRDAIKRAEHEGGGGGGGKRVLILYANVGSGHKSAANAVEEALLERAKETGEDVTVEKMDLFDFCAPAFKFAMQKMFQLLTQSLAGQHTLGFLYDSGDGANTKPKLQRAVEDWCSLGLLEEIARFRPDCVVATHFLPSQLVATLKRKSAVLGSRLNLKLVITDLDVQSMWVVPGAVDTYFVPREDAKTVLSTYLDKGRVMRSEAKGRRRYSKLSASENVVVSGIPIATRFARAAEIAKETGGRAKAMEMFGLDPGDKRPVVVLMSGGKIVQEVMESALGAEAGIRLVVVTGRQADVRAQLEAVPVPARHEVTLLGFCKEMPSLLLAADLMVGKCGGLTVAENAALGVPLIIVDPIPGQEQRNADILLEAGQIKCNDVCLVGKRLDSVFDGWGRRGGAAKLERMREGIGELAHARSAYAVADNIMERR
ncbi:hypothetical protein TeGR_g9586 [Tetraparma gracilis]|uniref:monogalactosyldiacylglycerol synthase n=1 Tax=Tetraparma gracilis TaxID=2962635 RepID=A0ABQ6N2D1_9STRA|nr:hypothetical protein TeGR_g9586 [Tetraparma gracilis]